MQTITSSNSKRYRDALQLHRSRGRKKQDRMIVFGVREISRAINSGVVADEIFLCDDGNGEKNLDTLRSALDDSSATEGVCHLLAADLFRTLGYGERPDNIIMTAGRPGTDLQALDDRILLRAGESAANALVVVCERLEKPGNLGGLVRSADGSGAAAVVIADAGTDAFHPNAIRNSAGAVFCLPVATGTAAEVRLWLCERGYRILVATPDAEEDFYQKDLTGKTAVVLGNEATGVSDRWRGGAVEPFRLPMLGIADSLNVSVTGAILMYEALRQNIGNSG